MNPGDTFSPDFPCVSCNATGELSHSRGHQGFICTQCAGTGARLCDLCGRLPASDVVDGNYACPECLPLTVSDVCWTCLAEIPIAMHEGLALCEACWDAARRTTTQPPPPERDTLPCLPGYPEAANDSPLEATLGASLAVAEAAHEGDVPPHECFRALRKAAGRRVIG